MNFVDTISSWINRHFSNEEAIYLVLLIVFIFGFLAVFGSYLAPVITGLIVAFLIQGIVVRLVLWGLPEVLAIGVVMILFLGALVALFVGVLPLVWRQMNQTIDAMPGVIDRIAELFTDLSATYPALFSEETVSAWLSTANAQLTELGGMFLQALVGQLYFVHLCIRHAACARRAHSTVTRPFPTAPSRLPSRATPGCDTTASS